MDTLLPLFDGGLRMEVNFACPSDLDIHQHAPIDSWSVAKATLMAASVPPPVYGFRFSTWDDAISPNPLAISPFYVFGLTPMTATELSNSANPNERRHAEAAAVDGMRRVVISADQTICMRNTDIVLAALP